MHLTQAPWHVGHTFSIGSPFCRFCSCIPLSPSLVLIMLKCRTLFVMALEVLKETGCIPSLWCLTGSTTHNFPVSKREFLLQASLTNINKPTRKLMLHSMKILVAYRGHCITYQKQYTSIHYIYGQITQNDLRFALFDPNMCNFMTPWVEEIHHLHSSSPVPPRSHLLDNDELKRHRPSHRPKMPGIWKNVEVTYIWKKIWCTYIHVDMSIYNIHMKTRVYVDWKTMQTILLGDWTLKTTWDAGARFHFEVFHRA